MILLDNNIIRKYARPDPDEAVLNYLSEVLLTNPARDGFILTSTTGAGPVLQA
ncbi:hypothetical protein [Haloarcula laminariae]|uniref:hypothetical protein n=1 Tax=Haloarcula laminariae TaxID=2961577 RepID=UPI0024061394|nr:hypothetical protein [Halomicroarcula sp. FL173]